MNNQMRVRGIRGAISSSDNNSDAIKKATTQMLKAIVQENRVEVDDIASAFFTVTKDLDAQFPAQAAREMGWTYVPMMCATEIEVPGSQPGLVRVMLHVNTYKAQNEIKHVYLGEAVKLRPDLVKND